MTSKDSLCVKEEVPGHARLKAPSTSNENATILATAQAQTLDIDQLDWTRAWENQQTVQTFQSLLNLNERAHNNESRLASPSKREGASVKVKTEQISPFTK